MRMLHGAPFRPRHGAAAAYVPHCGKPERSASRTGALGVRMSISSITSFAVARNLRAPTKADAGVATTEAAAAGDPPSLPEILAKTLPVGLVSAYTAFIAVVAEVVAEPTPAKPDPEQYLSYRWGALAVLVLLAATLTLITYRRKAGAGARFPALELSAVTVAAGAWGLGVPESPLLAAADKQEGLILIALIGFVGVGINAILSALLRSESK
jgi:hypothetical protein